MDLRELIHDIGQDYKWSWHRIPERERVCTPVSKAQLGYPFRIQRLVARVGYWLHYHDMPEHQLYGRIMLRAKEVLQNAGLKPEQVHLAIHYIDQKTILKEIQDEAVSALRRDAQTSNFAYLHVAWYFELGEPIWFSPQAIVYRYNGSYDPGYRGAEDFEPPQLHSWLRQGYYKGQIEYGYSPSNLVHPADILKGD